MLVAAIFTGIMQVVVLIPSGDFGSPLLRISYKTLSWLFCADPIAKDIVHTAPCADMIVMDGSEHLLQ